MQRCVTVVVARDGIESTPAFRTSGGSNRALKTGLLLFLSGCLLDKRGRLFCISVICETDDCRIPSANGLGDEKAQVGPSLRNRLGDFVRQTWLLSPSMRSVGIAEAASPVSVAADVNFFPATG
jgi:hypothetical protein